MFFFYSNWVQLNVKCSLLAAAVFGHVNVVQERYTQRKYQHD